MAHSFANLLTHVIFSTKGRAALIDVEIADRMFAYMGGIVREVNGVALMINGVADHVHILMKTPAMLSIADAMRLIKTNSSRWVHETWPTRRAFAWQTGYAAFSVCLSNVAEVQRYIAEQPEHHQKRTFLQELVAFLEKHGIPYDERYLAE